MKKINEKKLYIVCYTSNDVMNNKLFFIDSSHQNVHRNAAKINQHLQCFCYML